MPGIFLQVLLIQSVLVYHQAAFQPSEEDETVAPFVFNCGWLGHGKNSVGGSSLTFLREHHKNHSRKTVIGTKQMSQTEQQRKAPDTRQRHFSDESVRYKTCITFFSFWRFFFLTVQRRDRLQNTADGCGMRSHTKRDLLHNILAYFFFSWFVCPGFAEVHTFLCTHKHAARLH